MASRKDRGKTQRLYLIEKIKTRAKYKQTYAVMGATGNLYSVTMTGLPTCTCPDYRTKKRRCKHIFFIMLKVLGFSEEEAEKEKFARSDLCIILSKSCYLEEYLMADKESHDKYKKLAKVSTICSLCFEEIKKEEQNITCNASFCNIAAHFACFEMWNKSCKSTPRCQGCGTLWKSASPKGGAFSYHNLKL